MKTTQLDKPAKTLTQEALLLHLLHLEPKDVNLKFVFDHIRNYTICGGMLWAGVKILATAGQELTDIGKMFSLLAGGVLFALPWLLFALNLLQGGVAAFRLQESKGMSFWVYISFYLLVFIAASKFMLVIKAA